MHTHFAEGAPLINGTTRRAFAAAVIGTALAGSLAACSSSSAASSGPRTHNASPTRTAQRSTSTVGSPTGSKSPTASSATDSRYVPVAETTGVKIVPLPKRYLGVNGLRVDDNGIPSQLRVNVAHSVSFQVYRGDTKATPVGITMTATNSTIDCGAPFLATQGHGYVVTCTVIPVARGTIHVTLAEHDPVTGEPGTSATVPIPVR